MPLESAWCVHRWPLEGGVTARFWTDQRCGHFSLFMTQIVSIREKAFIFCFSFLFFRPRYKCLRIAPSQPRQSDLLGLFSVALASVSTAVFGPRLKRGFDNGCSFKKHHFYFICECLQPAAASIVDAWPAEHLQQSARLLMVFSVARQRASHSIWRARAPVSVTPASGSGETAAETQPRAGESGHA